MGIVKRVNLNNNVIWFAVILFVAVITGVAIVEKEWIYFVVVLSPLIIYLCIEMPFVFPLGLYAFLIPFDAILTVSGGGATLTKLLGALTIVVLSVKGAFENKLQKPNAASIWWVLFILYGFLTVWWAIEPDRTLARFNTAVGLLLLYLVVASYKLQKNEFETIKWCILLGGLLAAVFTIYTHRLGGMDQGVSGRASLEIANRKVVSINAFAVSLLIPVTVCVNQILTQHRKIIKGMFVGILGVMLYGIIITGSRGSMLAVAAIFIVYFLSAKQKITFSAIGIVVGIVLLSFVPDLFFSRWETAASSGGAGRTDIWYVGLKALEKYWPSGVGLSNFQIVYNEFAHLAPEFKGFYRAPHNIYLGFFVELGIVGFSFMILAMIKHYKVIQTRSSHQNIDAVMLRAAFWGILIACFFLDDAWRKSFWLLWMMIMMYGNVSMRVK